ncbi:hypothetical protein OIU35_32690 [Boseaceae bacterium BT-24-1]|nr:hypothetical protein [Boseaceae bacterium BT-24-1]
MPFRAIVAEPQELAKLSAAFDAAWIAIHSAAPVETRRQSSAARERLGCIIIDLWKQGEECLVGKGVERFLSQDHPDLE